MSVSPCRVAVVGAGLMAREHLRAFGDVPGVALVGVHSRTRARAEALAAEFEVPVVTGSVEELYEKSAADVVVVTVSELSAADVSRACFDFPWTVLLEKPPGYNLRVAEEIRAAASAAGRRVLVGLNRRFYSSTRAVLDGLGAQDGTRFALAQDQQDPQAALAAGKPEEVVENWMYANSIHVVDYLRLFCRGAVTKVTPVVRWRGVGSGLVVAQVEFDSGDTGLYQGTWDGPGPWAVSVSTPQRRWELRPLEQASVQVRGERRAEPIEPDGVDTTFKPGFRRQAEAVVEAAQGRPSDVVSLDDAVETMRLIAAIFGVD